MKKIIKSAKEVFTIQSIAIQKLSELLTNDFARAVKAIVKSKGRVIVSGIGKSGLVGKKIAATLASTGTPSFFIHPTEAFHGDLGMITKNDIFLGISKSGETEEMLRLVPFMQENGILSIMMTANPNSTLARHADFHLNVFVEKEACPLQLAPTTSTTAALVMGDALAVALMKQRNFREENFARLHPGGSLGKKLLTRVKESMVKRNLPLVEEHFGAKEVVDVTVKGSLGVSVVVGNNRVVKGIISAGDIMRAMEKNERFFSLKAKDMMTLNPKTITPDSKLIEAEEIMRKHLITALLVQEGNKLLGILHITDL